MEEELFKRMTATATRPSKHKLAIFSCGASNVGKTDNKTKFLKDAGIKTSYVYINIDKIQYILGVEHEKAQPFLKHIVTRTIEEEYSFFWDATCRNKNEIIKRMKDVKEKGYKIIFALTYADLPTVLKRASERITQKVDESVVRDIYQHMKKNAEVYMKVDDIDEIYLYSTEKTSQLIYYKDSKKIQCIHPKMNFYFDVSKYC